MRFVRVEPPGKDKAGDLERAIRLNERTLLDMERILGPEHPDTLADRHNLAYAYGEAGDVPRAISLYEKTLAAMEQVLGPDHPATLTCRANLASAREARATGDK